MSLADVGPAAEPPGLDEDAALVERLYLPLDRGVARLRAPVLVHPAKDRVVELGHADGQRAIAVDAAAREAIDVRRAGAEEGRQRRADGLALSPGPGLAQGRQADRSGPPAPAR